MSYERFELDETLSSIDERSNTMPNTKAGSSEQFQKGDDMESIEQRAERLRIVLSRVGLDDEQARRLLSVVGVDELTRRLDASDDTDELLNMFSEAEVKAIADIVLGM